MLPSNSCFSFFYTLNILTTVNYLDLELAIDPQGGGFVHYDFLKLHYIKNKLTHVSPLYVGALNCYINVNYITQNYIFRLR